MMLAGVPVPDHAIEKLASFCRSADADELADRLERALADGVSPLALTINERVIILSLLDAPPDGLAELRAVLLNEHERLRREGARLGTESLAHL